MKPIPRTEDLTLQEKIGQVLCFGWQGETPAASRTLNGHAREVLGDMRVGGIVVLSRNLGTPDEVRALLAEAQEVAAIPLLVSVDQEGGTVNRMRAPLHEFPGSMALGACGDAAEGLAYAQGRAQGAEAAALGLNWVCAPVVDVNSNPDNPIIGVRSFGEDPVRVGRLGAAVIRGLQDAGVLAGAKHFPGHGDAAVDSHLALPRIDGDRQRLERVELVPFRAAVDAGVASVMTTHILFPALDPDRPATMSAAILKGLLRGELGYEGLVVTDCLEMKAVGATVGTARGAVEALRSGADVALVCHTLGVQREVVAAVTDAVASGYLPRGRLDEAVSRVLAAKSRLRDPGTGDPWTDPAHAALEQRIARASITLVRRGPGFPLAPRATGRILVVSAHHGIDALAEALRRRHPLVEALAVPPDVPQASIAGAVAAAGRAACVVAATAAPEPWSDRPIDQARQAELVLALHSRRPDLVAVAVREPYDIKRFPRVETYLCSYGWRTCSLQALADVLLGRVEPKGASPVTIPV